MIMNKRWAFIFVCAVLVTATSSGFAQSRQRQPRGRRGRMTEQSARSGAVTHAKPVADPDFQVDIYDPEKACNGTTLFVDKHNRGEPRIVKMNMKGEIVWEYVLPPQLRRYTNPGLDTEPLPNGNILMLLPCKGIYEINPSGDIVWSHADAKMSHDADRLPNGNTLYVFGAQDKKGDVQVKEVDPKGKVVWTWRAKGDFDKPPYKDAEEGGWTHTNAVTRMKNGNTLISPRNFDCLVEVDPEGKVVNVIGEDFLHQQHDPEVLPNGNILVANHGMPHEVVEIDAKTEKVIWRFAMPDRKTWPVRDANRLPNGNTLITGSTQLVEVTPDKEIVWRLLLKNVHISEPIDAPRMGFYKAERIPN